MKGEKSGFPKKPFSTLGGIRLAHRKNTAAQESRVLEDIDRVVIPMLEHIGTPCEPLVTKGEHVYVGTLIGDSTAFLSAPIHSSVSGTVRDIVSVTLPGGRTCSAIEIESDGLYEKDPSVKPPVVNSPEELIAALRASGLVGLGGAGFPAHAKLASAKGREIDTLLINCAECEPYITSDHREVMENSWAVMSGIYAVKELLNVKRVIIGVENNKPDAIKLLKEIADSKAADPDDRVRVLPLKARYPQGAEKVLVKACTGRAVPMGKLPADVGCVVMNVASAAFISDYLKTGMPLVRKRLTVDGGAVLNPQNVIVPIGTPISKIMELIGGYSCECAKLLMGGPMMGLAVSREDTPVLKQNNAILAFGKKQVNALESTACIRCGRCVEACPMGLMPCKLEAAAMHEQTDALKALNAMNCMECGCCAAVCPARRHIVQSIRLGKGLLRKEALNSKGAEGKK